MDLKDKIMNIFWSKNIGSLWPKPWPELADAIVAVCQEEMHQAMAYWISEVNFHKEHVEELELELELEKNTLLKFPTPGGNVPHVMPKWRNLK